MRKIFLTLLCIVGFSSLCFARSSWYVPSSTYGATSAQLSGTFNVYSSTRTDVPYFTATESLLSVVSTATFSNDVTIEGINVKDQFDLIAVDTNTLQTNINTEATTRANADIAIGITTAALETSKVPYTGATGSVALGSYGISASTGIYSSTVTAHDFVVPRQLLSTCEYSTVNDYMNSFGSVGRKTGGVITDAGSQTVNVSSGTGLIKATDDNNAQLMFFTWASSSGISVPLDSIRYIGVKYNSGSPIIDSRLTNVWDLDTEFPLGSVINQSDDLYINNNPWWVTDGLTNIIERFQAQGYVVRDNYVGGLVLGYTGTRNPTLTAGTVWSRLNEFSIAAKDCSGTDTFYGFYRDGGTGWTRTTALSSWSVTEYDDNSGTLATLGANKYANFWVFIEIDTVNSGQLMLIYPQNSYNTSAAAEAESVPTFPSTWYEHGILVGRILFKQGTDIPIEVQSAFEVIFNPSEATDHNNLSNLQGGTANEYYHLTSSTYTTVQGWLTTIPAIQVGTGTLRTDIDGLFVSTGTLQTDIATLQVATGTLQGRIDQLEIDTGTLVTTKIAKTDTFGGAASGTYNNISLVANSSSTAYNICVASAIYAYNGGGSSVGGGVDTVPVGTIMTYISSSTIPDNYLYCDGTAVSRATYSALFAKIGTSFGVGDNSTTFNLPDLRGMFLRGVDNGANRDYNASRVIGSTEADTMQGHYHSITSNTFKYPSVGGSGAGTAFPDNASAVAVTIGSPTTDGTNGTPRVSTETVPENVAVAYIIKYRMQVSTSTNLLDDTNNWTGTNNFTDLDTNDKVWQVWYSTNVPSGTTSITVSGLGCTEDEHIIVDYVMHGLSDPTAVNFRLNGDSGNNYDNRSIYFVGAAVGAGSDDQTLTGDFSYASTNILGGAVNIYYDNTTYDVVIEGGAREITPTNVLYSGGFAQSLYNGSSALDSITILSRTGSWGSGQIRIWRLK